MTSKEKCLEEAINRIKYHNTDEPLKIVTVPFYTEEINALCDYFTQPTFDECIKEWEERGWTVDELKQFPVIKIWKLNKEQDIVDNIYVYPKKLNSKIDFDADYETLNLLTKTLKALENNNEKEN